MRWMVILTFAAIGLYSPGSSLAWQGAAGGGNVVAARVRRVDNRDLRSSCDFARVGLGADDVELLTCSNEAKAMDQESEVKALASAVFQKLRAMDASCATGLCNYVSVSRYAGKPRKDEAAITWGVTEALQKKWEVSQCEHHYPQGGGRCDRLVKFADGSRVWLEVKLASRAWFYEGVKWNDKRAYDGYLGGGHHSHSVAGDFTKLERIGCDDGRYLALLVVGFDGADGKMGEDMAALTRRAKLQQRGWRFTSDQWQTRQSAECWIRCWFWWRLAA